MAIPQDGLGSETVDQIQAYEATAELLNNPDVAPYIDADALKQTMQEALSGALDGAATALASDQAKLKEFLEAVKAEASAHGLSEVDTKVQGELEKAGGGTAGSGSGGGTGSGGDSGEHGEHGEHEGHEHEHEHEEAPAGEAEPASAPEPEPAAPAPEPEPEPDDDSDDGSGEDEA